MTEPRPRPSSVGSKFQADGTVRRFPGNTVICRIEPESALMFCLTRAHEAIRAFDVRKRFALLPPSSYHMTIFEGVCDQVRMPERWPSDLPLTATLDEVTAHFAAALALFRPAFEPRFRLRAVEPLSKWGPIVLALEPLNAGESRKLRDLRNSLSDALRLRAPGHDAYVFHITLGYAVDWPDAAEEEAMAGIYEDLRRSANELGPVELQEPEFCTFDDMFAFHRLSLVAN